MKKAMTWATTPDSKAKAAAGGDREKPKLNDCEKMQRARKAAEQVTRELREENEKEITASLSEMTGE